MHKILEVYDLLLRLCAGLAGLIFLAITLAIPVNVVLRTAFGGGLYGVLDAIEYGLLVATMLAAPWVLAQNGHVSVDLVVQALPDFARRWVARAADALGLVVSLAFVYYATAAALQSAARGSVVRKAFAIPEWWLLAVMPVSLSLIAVEMLRRLIVSGARGDRTQSGL